MSYRRLDDGTLEVVYEPTRADCWRFFVWRWRRVLWKFEAVYYPLLFVLLFVIGRHSHEPARGAAEALFLTILVWLSHPLLAVVILFRTGERLVQLSPERVSITRGNKSQSRPWRRLSRLEEDGSLFYLFGSRFNALIIPKRDLGSPAQQKAFGEAVRQILAAAQV